MGIPPEQHKSALDGGLTFIEGMALAKALGCKAKDIVSEVRA